MRFSVILVCGIFPKPVTSFNFISEKISCVVDVPISIPTLLIISSFNTLTSSYYNRKESSLI